jgi:hypothetical protein
MSVPNPLYRRQKRMRLAVLGEHVPVPTTGSGKPPAAFRRVFLLIAAKRFRLGNSYLVLIESRPPSRQIEKKHLSTRGGRLSYGRENRKVDEGYRTQASLLAPGVEMWCHLRSRKSAASPHPDQTSLRDTEAVIKRTFCFSQKYRRRHRA